MAAVVAPEKSVRAPTNITLRQSLFPIFLVTILYILWGFALLDVLNKYLQEVLHISRMQSSGVQSAYFGSYLVGPLTYSGWTLRRYGYKATFILGLCIYSIGCLIFWPSAVYRSFPGFCGAMFVLGSGLSTLETAANPFVTTCGPPRYAEIRLNLAQAVQGSGYIIAPVLASQVFFKSEAASNDLAGIRYVYLGVACFCCCLIVLFIFAPIPEISDADMDNQVAQAIGTSSKNKSIWKERTLLYGVFAQFCFLGSQCSVAGFFINVVTEMSPGLSSAQASNFLSIANAIFAIGRLAAAIMMKLLKPRYVLFGFLSGCIIFLAATMRSSGHAGLAMIAIMMFFESTCYPTIFSIAVRGLGANTKRGASFVVASVCGGAIFPAITGAIGDRKHSSRFALCVPLTGLCLAWTFPVYCHLFERERLDGLQKSGVGLIHERGDVESGSEDSVTMEHA